MEHDKNKAARVMEQYALARARANQNHGPKDLEITLNCTPEALSTIDAIAEHYELTRDDAVSRALLTLGIMAIAENYGRRTLFCHANGRVQQVVCPV